MASLHHTFWIDWVCSLCIISYGVWKMNAFEFLVENMDWDELDAELNESMRRFTQEGLHAN